MTEVKQAHFIILSGRYCSAEISAEFGKLPPSFLPLGQSRLYERQLALARACKSRPVLTIPANYALSTWDREYLAREEVRVVRAPETLSLNEAVQFVLEVLDGEGPLYLLYGDTLVEGEGLEMLDLAAVHLTRSNYHWAEVHSDPQEGLRIASGYGDGMSDRSVLCGYFSFSDSAALRRACVEADSFDRSIEIYDRNNKLSIVQVRDWHDFGHLSLIYKSRRSVMVSRAFNSIYSDGAALIKTSSKKDKIRAEANWYESIPGSLRLYTPQYLGQDYEAGSYRLEYMFLPTLSELVTFGELPTYTWHQILDSCLDFLRECRRHRPAVNSEVATPAHARRVFENLYRRKTLERVREFTAERGWKGDEQIIINDKSYPPLREICEILVSHITPTTPEDITVWHGDFFFGNILYDFRAGRVRTIDPRGGDSETEHSIYGDCRYDVAKLGHSIMGGYDSLLAGWTDFKALSDTKFSFYRRPTPAQEGIAKIFAGLELDGSPVWTVEMQALTALLFLTMLPLHADDHTRQSILMCNGILLAESIISAGVVA